MYHICKQLLFLANDVEELKPLSGFYCCNMYVSGFDSSMVHSWMWPSPIRNECSSHRWGCFQHKWGNLEFGIFRSRKPNRSSRPRNTEFKNLLLGFLSRKCFKKKKNQRVSWAKIYLGAQKLLVRIQKRQNFFQWTKNRKKCPGGIG